MSFNLFDYFSLEFSEYLEQVICKSFENDESHHKDQELIDELTNTLTKGQAFNTPINRLIDAMIRQEDCNREVIYWQGWKDCVKLLQAARLLSVSEAQKP